MKKYYKLSKNYWLMIGHTKGTYKFFIRILDNRKNLECW